MRSTIPILICCLYALSAVNAIPSSKGQNAEVQQGNTEAAEAPKLWSDDKDNNDDKDDKWGKDDEDDKDDKWSKDDEDDKDDKDHHDCALRAVSILIGTSTYAIPCLPNGRVVNLNGIISPPAATPTPGSSSAASTTTTTTTDTTTTTTTTTTNIILN